MPQNTAPASKKSGGKSGAPRQTLDPPKANDWITYEGNFVTVTPPDRKPIQWSMIAKPKSVNSCRLEAVMRLDGDKVKRDLFKEMKKKIRLYRSTLVDEDAWGHAKWLNVSSDIKVKVENVPLSSHISSGSRTIGLSRRL